MLLSTQAYRALSNLQERVAVHYTVQHTLFFIRKETLIVCKNSTGHSHHLMVRTAQLATSERSDQHVEYPVSDRNNQEIDPVKKGYSEGTL